MANLLTSDQIDAIASGAPVRQVWKIKVPTSSGAAPSYVWGIHDDAGNNRNTVTRRGSRENSAFNVSLMEPGNIGAMPYSIEVDNSGGYFHAHSSFNYFQGIVTSPPSTYQAQPRECLLVHEVYVLVSGSWSELPCSPWVGKIKEVEYNDTIRDDGSVVYGPATIHAEGYVSSELAKPWGIEHGEISEIDTGMYPSGLHIGNVERGWDLYGGYVRYWYQFDSSVSATFTVYYYQSGSLQSSTVGTGTTHQFSVMASPAVTVPGWFVIRAKMVGGGFTKYFADPWLAPITRDMTTEARPW